MERLIMGIDPGTNFMGYAIIRTFGKTKRPELIVSGVLDMDKIDDPYIKLQRIFQRTLQVIDSYQPDELAIEAQFFGKNIQSMLKLGRAQGVAIAAALQRDIPIFEYAPKKIKMSVTGSGTASKEQVAVLLGKFMDISTCSDTLDETDAIAIAFCHHLQGGLPTSGGSKAKNWSDYVKKNPGKVKK
ncbi:crossover junction endodeoxyribonuclease RuvC [Odoribacter sp. OttesenSCG-928-G04]|nr:crossover junction endodeoxyribonuclease RuvC [Odoribacter sp. OttesenSCG-928-G04]MDL2330596.1 crossover junction endodeoxyribonuclease RuvC [Odoribacter sp. OttesenSCG-928-A06]